MDWFAATVALVVPEAETASSLLATLARRPTSPLMWPQRGLQGDGISPLYSFVAHAIETIAETELPMVVNAFRLCG